MSPVLLTVSRIRQCLEHILLLTQRGWGLRLEPLSTQVRVRLDARGNVIGEPRVERGSGNPWYDDSTIRAVRKASPLPAPPRADTYIIEFRPEDYF